MYEFWIMEYLRYWNRDNINIVIRIYLALGRELILLHILLYLYIYMHIITNCTMCCIEGYGIDCTLYGWCICVCVWRICDHCIGVVELFFFLFVLLSQIFFHPHFSLSGSAFFHWLSCSLVIFIETKSINFDLMVLIYFFLNIKFWKFVKSISKFLTEFIQYIK